MPPTTHSVPPTPGDTIGSYTLLESIGLGGNATVFKAKCPTQGVVAIKVLHPGKLAELDIKRFHREFQAMKALRHPNIIEVYESGMHKSYPWMSMELVTGGDLSDQITIWNATDASPNTFAEITHTFSQLCMALGHMHSKGMIHRDIKPSNVLLTEHKQVKLTDFGGVKAPHSFKTDLTVLGNLIGTVAFMAPEQILGEPVDPRTDLYALGAVLYMSLTGSKPFVAKTMAEYLAKHLNQAAPCPSELRPEAPKHLTSLCTQLMQKEPRDRPQSAYSVHKALQTEDNHHLLGAEEVITGVTSWLQTHNTGLILIFGHQGMGTKSCFKHIIEHHKKSGWNVHIGSQLPPSSGQRTLIVLTESIRTIPKAFFTDLQLRTQNNEQLVVIVNTIDKWKALSTYLTVPKQAFALQHLSEAQIQQLLQPFGLNREGRVILSKRLLALYNGKIEYIREVLRHEWVYTLKSLSTEKLKSISIPSSHSCIQHQAHLLSTVPASTLPVLTVLLLFENPISTGALTKLMNISSDDIGTELRWLNRNQWIEIQETGMDRLIVLHTSRLGQFLQRLISTEERILWNQKIGNLLLQKSRLRPADRKKILHHLAFLGPSKQTNIQHIALAKYEYRQQHFEAAIAHVQALNNEWMDVDTQLEMKLLLTNAYCHANMILEAKNTILETLQYNSISQDIKKELQIKLFVLQHRHHPIDGSPDHPDTRDTVIDTLVPNNHFEYEAVLLCAVQHLYRHNIIDAKRLFTLVSEGSRDGIVSQQAGIGLEFIERLENDTLHVLSIPSNLVEHTTMPWYLWYLEFLLVSGSWTRLTEHLVEQRAFDRQTMTEEVFEAWSDYLQGNAPRARERIEQLNLSIQDIEQTPSALRLLIHIVRLQKRLHLKETPVNLEWKSLPTSIDALKQQWTFTQGDTTTISNIPLYWHRDLMILDAAFTATNEIDKERLWNGLSDQAWGVKIQVSKLFSKDTSATKWQDIHGQTIRECARNMAGDIHIWH